MFIKHNERRLVLRSPSLSNTCERNVLTYHKREESLRRVRSSQQRMFGDVIVVSTTEAVSGSSRHITSTLANYDYSTVEE